MANEKEILKLDLDTLDFLKKAGEAKGAISEIGEAKNLVGLISHIKEVGLMVGGMGAAFLALKGTMDLVFEGENVRAINQQFELLTRNAKLSTDTLRDGLIEAAGGLIDDTDLLKIANKAIVDMGASAAKLPQLMEVARKSTAIMGGDLKENFDRLAQAIGTGQMRALKQMGLEVKDVDKVYRDYAKTIGASANELNDAGKRQALLNAVIEKGKTAFAGINPDIKEAQNTWQQLHVTIAQMAEVLTLAFEKTVGPALRTFLSNLRGWAGEVKTILVAQFGEGAEQSTAQLEVLENKLRDLKGQQIDLEQKKIKGFGFDSFDAAMLNVLPAKIAAATAEVEKARAAVKSVHAEGEGGGRAPASEGGLASADQVDKAKRLENERKFQHDLLQMRMRTAEAQLHDAQSVAQADEAMEARKRAAAEETGFKIAELLRKQAETNVDQHVKIDLLNQELYSKLKAMDADLDHARIAALDRWVQRSENTAQGIGRGFAAASQKSALALKDFGKRGSETFDSVGKHSAKAFSDIGAGTATLGQAMKGMFLNVLADRASAEGNLLLLSGLWPPNPVALAAGAGLLALGGFLRSQAGSGGGAGAPSGGGGGGGGPESGYKAGELAGVSDASKPAQPEEFRRRSVAINVHGNYFETEETRRRMMEMIRQETDATDFTYSQVGKG